jgi:hypothetical protein
MSGGVAGWQSAVIRYDPNNLWRIHHYWPDTQRLEPLPGWVSISTTIPL